MFPGRRERSQTSEGADEGGKSVKPDICARTSANNGSCASNIDSKIEQRFKRKFAYLIWTSAYRQSWPSWLQAEHLQAWCHRKCNLFVFVFFFSRGRKSDTTQHWSSPHEPRHQLVHRFNHPHRVACMCCAHIADCRCQMQACIRLQMIDLYMMTRKSLHIRKPRLQMWESRWGHLKLQMTN